MTSNTARQTPDGDETMTNETLTLKDGYTIEWDAAEGSYYDPNTDLYLTLDQFNAMAGLT
jgi:hypothetical protein